MEKSRVKMQAPGTFVISIYKCMYLVFEMLADM